jgi:UDP-glucose 4-epimerase
MKVLVTGGAGFIGSHIVEGYIDAGLEVVALDNLSRGSLDNLRPGVPFYKVDLRDQPSLETTFRTEKPDIVNHHAAQINVRRSVEDPQFDFQSNILGSLHLLNLAVRYKVSRFIFASTGGAIYGKPDLLPAGEETPARPLAPYGVSKLAVEHYLSVYRSIHGLPSTILRYGNVYGPRQNSEGEAGVVAIFCEQMLRGIRPTIYGDGTKTRDYVEVSDVVRANLSALDLGNGEALNIASGRPTSDYEVFAAVREALMLPLMEPNFAPVRPGEVNHIFLDVSRARQRLGWSAKVKLSPGVQRTADWFRRRLKDAAVSPAKVMAHGDSV